MRATTRTPKDVERDLATLYKLAYAAGRLARTSVGGPRGCGRVRAAAARTKAANALARRILARPGVAEHDETDYARSLLRQALNRLTGPEAELLLLAEAAGLTASSRPGVHVAELLDLADVARHLARYVATEKRSSERERIREQLESLRGQAVGYGLTAEEAGGITEVKVDATLPAIHPRVLFSNAISTRGFVRVCFWTQESAEAAASGYRPYNNTRAEMSICTAEHGRR